jgi:hypothetical protein
MDKFRDKDGNWRENVQRVEEDIPEFAVSYSVQEDEKEKGKVKFERKRNGSKGLCCETERL